MDESVAVQGEKWVSAEEVATHLGVGKESVYRWVESRGLPAHRVGRLFRFRLSEIDAWVAGQRVDRVAETRAEYGAATVAPTRAKWPLSADEIRAAIEEMVRIIVEKFDPDQIILFGSHARGNAGTDSDVDLLVVMDFEGSKREKQVQIRVALHEVPVPMDIIVASPAEIEKYRDIVGTVIRPALREGITLHQRAA